jgi:hypothetical protein
MSTSALDLNAVILRACKSVRDLLGKSVTRTPVVDCTIVRLSRDAGPIRSDGIAGADIADVV